LAIAVVAEQATVQPNGVEEITEHCPPSYPHPVGPDFAYLKQRSVAGSVALAASYPQGPHAWFTAVRNLTPQMQGVVMGAVCLRANGRFAYPRGTLSYPRPNRDVKGDGYNTGYADCPRAAPHAIDDYFGTQLFSDTGALLLSDTNPFPFHGRTTESTGLRNLINGDVRFFDGAVCTSLHAASFYGSNVVAGGGNSGITGRCPRKTPVPVSGTFYPRKSADGGKIAMVATQPLSQRAWSMGVTGLTTGRVKYLAGVICVGQ
jgi:hypothetical protein